MSKRKRIVNIVTLCLLVCVAVGAFWAASHFRQKDAAMTGGGAAPRIPDQPYYITQGKEYDPGLYDIQWLLYNDYVDLPVSDNVAGLVLDYPGYQALCERYDLEQSYSDPDKSYVIVGGVGMSFREIAKVDAHDNVVNVYMHWIHFDTLNDEMILFIIPLDAQPRTVNVYHAYTEAEYQNLIQYGTVFDPNVPAPEPAKPILYLYPEAETDVTVTLGYPGLVTHSYPRYDGPWRVTAQPDGTLTDLETGRALYSLYYENVSAVPLPQTDKGFVVRGADTAAFLEEKLAILGLTEREAEEFIVYWLPRLEENEWNYIRFASGAEIEAEMPLDIDPRPDSLIRVLMLYRGLDAPVEVTEQPLETPRRTGFTAVEWGGAEIN